MGNLRTAILAWAGARGTGRRFLMRVEDIDTQRSSAEAGERQLQDLAAIGLDWDGEAVWQTQRAERHQTALEKLIAAGHTYECYCSRREIAQALSAPHAQPGRYPGTCRNLSEDARQDARRRLAGQGRLPALRLRGGDAWWQVEDLLAGTVRGQVDDIVLRRSDGALAYNLVVVVDDGECGVDQVVRGDDLLGSAPTQAYLAHLLGLPAVAEYVHVPLVLGPTGRRLAKRDGAVTLRQLAAQGFSVTQVVGLIGKSLGVCGAGCAQDILDGLAEKAAAGAQAGQDGEGAGVVRPRNGVFSRHFQEAHPLAVIPRSPWVFVPQK